MYVVFLKKGTQQNYKFLCRFCDIFFPIMKTKMSSFLLAARGKKAYHFMQNQKKNISELKGANKFCPAGPNFKSIGSCIM